MLKLINRKFEHLDETKDLAVKLEHLDKTKDLATRIPHESAGRGAYLSFLSQSAFFLRKA
jgi:hypothetical protein